MTLVMSIDFFVKDLTAFVAMLPYEIIRWQTQKTEVTETEININFIYWNQQPIL